MGFFRNLEDDIKELGRDIDDEILQPVKNTVEAIVEDPKKLIGVAIAVAFPGAGAALGAQLGLSGVAAQVVGQAIINTATNGGDVKAAVIGAALPVVGQQASQAIGNTLAQSGITGAVNNVITDAATRGLTAAALGKDPLAAMVLSGTTSAVNLIAAEIPGFGELHPSAQSAIKNAVATKLNGGSVGQSLVDSAVSYAANEVTTYRKRESAMSALAEAGLDFGSDYSSLDPEQQAAIDAIAKAPPARTQTESFFDKFFGRPAPQPGTTQPELIEKYKDSLYTDESEAYEMARAILGREPTEFEAMEFIGTSESNAKSVLEGIRYDESTFDSNELAEAYKAVYGKEPTAEWLASDEAMDMLGRSDAQGRNMLQEVYTKDKNWVTEAEAKQFWKDMGNTGSAPQEFLDAMLMTTENGARAMAETYRINAEDIAATTFDGSQYATPQEAAAAAKAAGFNAFTHKDKNLTYFTQPSPIEEANIRADVEEKKTFSEAFAAARKELGAGKTFTWNGKQYTTNVMPKDTFDASRSSTIATAATLALANGKDKFIGPDGKTYKLDDNAKSVLANSVNQSAAETQRLLNLKPTTDETPAETQRLMEAGTRGTMDTIGAMTAQALGTTQRGLGNFLSNAGKTYAAMTGDLDFDNAAIRLGKEIETYAKGNDIYGLDVQKNRLSQAMARANETDNWIEKTKILGSAIGKNSLGFFDVAGSEVVEELPETVLQIGAALMTGGTTLAAKGAVAAIGAAGSVMETFGSTVEETYDKAKKAGFSNSEAMDKAYLNGVLSTAIEAGTNFVADKAMLAPFLNKFTGTLAGTATGFVSSTAIGAASELAAGLSQSYATQYMINPETASLSKAATDGIFEMFIGGTAQGTMGLPGYAIQGGAIIGKDYSGRDVTMADVAAGAVLDSSTVNPNVEIATSEDGDPVTLGGAMLQMPNYQFDMSTLKTYVPQVFNNDNLIVGQDESGNDVTFGDLMEQTTDSKSFDVVYRGLLDITPQQRADKTASNAASANVTPAQVEKIVNDAIKANPSLTAEDVQKIVSDAVKTVPNLTADQVKQIVGTEVSKLPVGATSLDVQKAVDAAKADLTKAVEKVASGAATGDAELKKAIDALKASGLTPADVQKVVDASAANQSAATKQAISDATKGLATTGALEAATRGLATTGSLEAAKAELAKEIQAARDIGLQGDAALQAGLGSLAAKMGVNQTEVLKQLGTTAADLKNQFASEISGVKTELAQTEKDILAQVAKNEAAGMGRDAALQKAIGDVAITQKTDAASLLSKLGTTEAALKSQITTQVAGLDAKLSAAIADAKAAGLSGDAALKSAIDKVAADQKTSSASLLGQLGKTEAALKTQFSTELSGVKTQISELEKSLSDEIQAARDIGLQGDAALQAGLNSLSAKMGTNQSALLGQLGKTEAALKTQFASEISGVQAEIAQTEKDILAQVAKNEAAGLSRDAALQKAIGDVAAVQKTDAASLLSKLGTTETALKSQIAGLSTTMASQYNTLSAAQKATADALVAQGKTMQEAIAAAQKATTGQIAGLEAKTTEQYNALTAAQKAEADARVAQGQNLQDAIAGVSGQVAGIGTQLTQQGKDFAAQLVQQGMDYKTAMQTALDAQSALFGTQIGGVQSQLAAAEAARQADLQAQLAREEAAKQAAAQAAKQANIQSLRTQGQQGVRSVIQQLQDVQTAGMAPQPVQVVEAGPGFDISDALNTGFFSGFQAKKAQQNQPQTTKIAAGGYIDDLLAEGMSVDDLLNLLR